MIEFGDRTFILLDAWENKTKVNITIIIARFGNIQFVFVSVQVQRMTRTENMNIRMYIFCSYVQALFRFEQFILKFMNAYMHCIQLFTDYIWL